MLRISWLASCIALIMLPVTGVLTSRIVKRNKRYFVAQQKNLGDINGKVEETYAGRNVVRAFNREGATQKEFDAINAAATARREGVSSFCPFMSLRDDVCQLSSAACAWSCSRLARRARHPSRSATFRHSPSAGMSRAFHAADHAAGADQHPAADYMAAAAERACSPSLPSPRSRLTLPCQPWRTISAATCRSGTCASADPEQPVIQ